MLVSASNALLGLLALLVAGAIAQWNTTFEFPMDPRWLSPQDVTQSYHNGSAILSDFRFIQFAFLGSRLSIYGQLQRDEPERGEDDIDQPLGEILAGLSPSDGGQLAIRNLTTREGLIANWTAPEPTRMKFIMKLFNATVRVDNISLEIPAHTQA